MPAGAVPVELFVSRWGRGARGALLIHGLGSASSTWWRVAEAVAGEGFAVAAPDLRGHGLSPRATSYGIDALVTDLLELGGGWEVAVGHSLGGLLAARAAVDDPGFAAALVLLDPVFEIPAERFEEVVAEQVDEVARPLDAEAILRANPRWHPEDAANKARAVRMTSPYVVERILRDNAPWSFAHVAQALVVPTMILGADPGVGGLLDPRLGERLAAGNPRISFRVVAGAAHSIQREEPGVVLDAVRSLVGQLHR
ncbi:MAG TPA: alpha/beta fold hydrolase [Actinomycetota bacterium]|nr:alpha/beta fold hydrolase [Actinomycetota bacterium]